MDLALLETEYSGAGNRHTLRLHVRPVNPSPVGPDHDYIYLPWTGDPAAEVGVLDTFAAFGAAWALYYPSTWSLALVAVWAGTFGPPTQWDALAHTPLAVPVPGALDPILAPVTVARRRYALYTATGARRRLWLSQVPGSHLGDAPTITPDGGGLDDRDPALVGYVSSAVTALVSWDGSPFLPLANLRTRFDRPTA